MKRKYNYRVGKLYSLNENGMVSYHKSPVYPQPDYFKPPVTILKKDQVFMLLEILELPETNIRRKMFHLKILTQDGIVGWLLSEPELKKAK